MTKEIYELGEIPPLGEVPKKMYAQVIRPSNFGDPNKAFTLEQVDVPEILPDEVLVYVMSAGVNYNNVWAALGIPIDVTKNRPKDPYWPDASGYHIGGSDASGIVWKIGSNVKNLKVGDEVVVHCGQWKQDGPLVKQGKDPMYDPSFRIWGYENSWGSFAQFTRVQDHQCLPKPKHLTWEASSAYMLVGATAYRMLHGWKEHSVGKGDVVLIWGATGGLGSMAIQIVKAAGGIPVAVVGGEDKFEFCKKLGAVGCIDRKKFNHWGMLPHWKDNEKYNAWASGAKAFGKAIWEAIGEKKSPKIVFEHPGEDTVPTSIFVCDTGGMVVICAGTTGYNATIDLRYHWMRQKRFQGSHFANDEQSIGFNNLVLEGKVDPCLSKVFEFKETGSCHQLMKENKHPQGNMAILVNAKKQGLKNLEESRKA
ncbi:crotonyl-CoA carboxylase/reductase [bacterium]|nr:crotonyl-CoA carboxylase/reductase [bacterium]